MRSVGVWFLVCGLAFVIVTVVTGGPDGSAAVRGGSLASVQAVGPRGALSAPVASAPEPEPTPSAAVAEKDTPVGRQVTWLVAASHRIPLPDSEIEQHLSPAVLASLSPAQFNEALAEVGGTTGFTLQRYQETSNVVAQILFSSDTGTWQGGISVDSSGLINGINFVPAPPTPTSWGDLDRRLSALAPRASMLAARLDESSGSCQRLHALAGDAVHPLGSAFKLYVLAALAQAVQDRRATWSTPLAIREDWKSLPTGQFQDLPAGTSMPLQSYADNMISISDNTAADHLIHRLGKGSVEDQLALSKIGDPNRNLPFLTTREFFQLKLSNHPALLNSYVALPQSARAAFLADSVDPLPLPSLEQAAAWTTPRGIDSVEWFASPTDICRAFGGLAQQSASASGQGIAKALSINDGGLLLDPATWSTTWFKGGSEPGVLTLNYLARQNGGATYVVSVMLSDPTAALPEASIITELMAVVRGGFALAIGDGGSAPAGPASPATGRAQGFSAGVLQNPARDLAATPAARTDRPAAPERPLTPRLP
jgi:beta-lactamase class A